jgi:hypothetical protein
MEILAIIDSVDHRAAVQGRGAAPILAGPEAEPGK